MFTTNELNELTIEYKKCIGDKLLKFSNEQLRTDFLALLDDPSLSGRTIKWKAILENASYADDLPKLANPFFIGYGNPSPQTRYKVLFLGKELGFEINERKDLFFNESINSIIQWENIDEKKETLNFNPQFPQRSIKKADKRHTWAYCTKLLVNILDDQNLSYPKSFLEDEKYSHSFFSKCFMTEISYIPSKEGKKLNTVRKAHFFDNRITFLKNYILPKFNIIIIGASKYFDDNQTKMEEQLHTLFGKVKECKLAHYEDRRILPFLHYITETDKHIYITKQLSGGASWSNEGLNGFGKRIKAYFDDEKSKLNNI